MDPSEYYDFEDRRYINPTLSRDEQLGFVDTLRDTVGRNTAQINTQTKALGSDLSSTQGGLTGSNSYFTQRYQTLPIETQVQTLKATAQAKALNDLMNNYQNQAANRYNQAYRRARARAATAGDDAKGDYEQEDIETFDLSNAMTLNSDEWGGSGESNVTGYMTPDGYEYWVNTDTGKMLKTNDPNYAQGSDKYWYNISEAKNKYNTPKLGLPFISDVTSNVLGSLGLLKDKDYADMVSKQSEAKKKQQTRDYGFLNSFLGF